MHGHSHSHGHSHLQASEPHTHFHASSAVKLIKLAMPEMLLLVLGTVSLTVSAVINLAMPYAMGKVFDADKQADAFGLIKILAGVFAAGIVFTFLRGFIFIYAGERLVARLRNRLFGNIIIQEVAFFDKNKTGELVNRLSADTSLIQIAATFTLSTILKFLVQILGGTFALLLISWQLTFALLLPVPVLLLFGWMYGRFVRRLGIKIQQALADCTSVAEEVISGMRYVRSFGNEDQEKVRFADKVGGVFVLGKRMALVSGFYQSAAELSAYVSIVLVIMYGTVLFLDGDISKGSLLSFVLYTIYVAHALGAFSSQVGEFMRAVGASERVFELLDKEPDMNIVGGTVLSEVKGHIKFVGVDFAYPSRSDVPVLQNFSLEFLPDRVVALVGPSGGGKTTIAQLVLRLYDPQQGKILLDGVPIGQLDPRWLREQIGFVSQEPVLFNTTIRENIAYGFPDASQKQIEAAAKAAFIHDFIVGLPEQYETIVGERGVRLSGGQKQRIAISRAILKEPSILILDEATSALDAESEHLVQKALEKLMKNRTVIVIAHRLSTIRNASTVAVIQGGKIIESGTHDELVEKRGVYFKLASRQLEQVEHAWDLHPSSTSHIDNSDQHPSSTEKGKEITEQHEHDSEKQNSENDHLLG